jgi:hypothetical protein
MNRISDVLELLTTQHEEIDRLVNLVMDTPDLEDRYRILDGLGTKLTTHLAIEQELIYPEAGALISIDVLREVMSEHGEIKRILADLLWLEPEGKHFETRLTALRHLLAGHTAYQEDDLFVQIAESLSPLKLAHLTETIQAWSDPPAFAIQAA